MTSEEFCPTRFIVGNPSRSAIAEHARKLWRAHGSRTARAFLLHAVYVGFVPAKKLKVFVNKEYVGFCFASERSNKFDTLNIFLLGQDRATLLLRRSVSYGVFE